MHKQALKAKRIGYKAQPQQVAVQARHLAPDCAQVQRALRYLYLHNLFYCLAVGLAMNKAADTANALGNKNEIRKVLFLYKLFKAAMNKTDGRYCLYNFFIFNYKVKVNGIIVRLLIIFSPG
jgi:hypothetical protein